MAGRVGAPLDPALWRVVGDPLVAGAASGALLGRGVAVKDLFAVAGHRVGAGVPDWLHEQEPAKKSAPAVKLLLDAGAHVVGIAQTDEFAFSIGGINSHYGAPPNPAAPHATTGGSSNGPGSAVALGQADIGLGTDTAGSIRVPASYLGIVGFRSTHGLVSMDSAVALAPSFDAAGWLTRDVATAIDAGWALIPFADRLDWKPVKTVRLPHWQGRALTTVESAAKHRISALVASKTLPPLDECSISGDILESWFTAFRTCQGWQAWQQRGSWISTHPASVGADVAARFAAASAISKADAEAASLLVAEATAYFRDLLQSAVLVLPATATPAVPLSATSGQTEAVRAATLRTTFIASVAGLPAVSLPVLSVPDSWQDAELPVGLSLVAAPGADHALLDLAARVEAACRQT